MDGEIGHKSRGEMQDGVIQNWGRIMVWGDTNARLHILGIMGLK